MCRNRAYLISAGVRMDADACVVRDWLFRPNRRVIPGFDLRLTDVNDRNRALQRDIVWESA